MVEFVKLPAQIHPKTIFRGWWVVAVGVLGQGFGTTALLFFALSVFITPLSAEFAWPVAQVASVTTLIAWTIVVASPLQGLLVDHFGVRRVLLPSSAVFAAGFASLYFLPPSLPVYCVVVVLLVLVGVGTYPASYAKAAAGWFDKRLGLAIGIVSAGSGLGATILPTLAQYWIAGHGWRSAFALLGGLSVLLTFVPALFLLRNHASDLQQGKDGLGTNVLSAKTVAAADWRGFTLRQVLTQKNFLCAAIAFLLLGAFTTGLLANQVPMLISFGHSAERAAHVQSAFGIALILGRLLGGYLLDRIFAPHLMIGFVVGPIIALLIYTTAPTGNIVFLCSFLVGLAIGAEADVMAYFIMMYFGRFAYGKIYGVLYSVFYFGAGAGTYVLAQALARWGGYAPGLWVLIGTALLACAALVCVDRHPRLPPQQIEA
ncbi:MFS transporter [Labrys sp. KB_33_2]|uniref:MFS transporter n=1 Tax=Labrys sp. KB_33_2 TaxID=3237479 RepID=UPI003F8FFAE2